MSDQWSREAETSSSSYKSTPSHRQTLAAQKSSDKASSEQVRSRWTPKPDQILILESIFNSGMVNPPKDETIRIRRLLQKFCPVADANVFYWFQNRRSRSRRRQRQIQANMEANARNALHYNNLSSNFPNPDSNWRTIPSVSIPASSSTFSESYGIINGVEGVFSEMGFEEMEENISKATGSSSFLSASDVASDLQYQQPGRGEAGFVTVFINGVSTEVPRGPLDMNEMCGQDFSLVHSSGLSVPINEYGFSTHSLQHGESYFLVGKLV